LLTSLSALGIVFGDIGTSPLYTLKTVLAAGAGGGASDPFAALGVLSLILWTLILVTTVKYVNVAMRVDNDGEGGILALMSLLGIKRQARPVIVTVGLIGAALIYGDGAITPAISVLSALEGLNIVTPEFGRYVLPASVVILLALFFVQSKGTARIGKAFGPVMALWFLTIALLGLRGVLRHPAVLRAISPWYALHYLCSGGGGGFMILGGVFLCVTGAEALYADMGHFGAKPIRRAWEWIVFPSLVLNYAGQTALVLEGAPISDNIFYRLCPQGLLLPLVILAALATIIASQSIITGAFSMTRQAIQLGWMPRFKIVQTSASGYGQIYVGAVNWMLMMATLGLTIGFGKSDNLASAYGVAVSATMLATSCLLYIAMREIWGWGRLRAGLLAGGFIVMDSAFFVANLSKIEQGGYVPVLLALLVYAFMFAWHKGNAAVMAQMRTSVEPIGNFLADAREKKIPRVPGLAVFLTRTEQDAPPVLVWHLRQNRALHEQVFILKVTVLSVPWCKDAERLRVQELAPGVWRAEARYGFMEHIRIPNLLKQARESQGCSLNLEDVTYYVGHETIMRSEDPQALPRWIEAAYAFMRRNTQQVSEYLGLPSDAVVEIGRQVAI
jgi:KUP system potassium uptake protein